MSTLCEVCVAITPTGKIKSELCGTYLKILEQGVDCFEPLYSEDTSSCGPDTGFYDFRRYGNWTHPRNEPYHTLCMIPGNGQVILSYAVLLKYTEQQYFGSKRVSRKTLFEHARKAIRWICQTSAYVENPCPFLPEVRKDLASGKQWKRRWGMRQDLLGYLSTGVAVLWDDLDSETKHLFKQVAAGAALKIIDGKNPADIPIVTNKRAKIFLNMVLAKKMGIKFPMSLIEHAQFVE
jgi:hypothetical protein